MELLHVDLLEEAKNKLRDFFDRIESHGVQVELEDAFGLIAAEDIVSPEAVPAFNRSTVDGYAVVAADTYGASESIPSFLSLCGDVAMGESSKMAIHSGQCAYVPTGGMVPDGADSMVMIEHTEMLDQKTIGIYSPSAVYNNINRIGDDMKSGDLVVKKGTRLRSQEIAALATLGITKVRVNKPMTCAIFSTGDELVPIRNTPEPGQIRESNSYYLRYRAKESGLLVTKVEFLPDQEAVLENAVREALLENDIVFLSGGSSQGKKDMTATLFDRISGGGVCTHGLALKPGKPTILGFDDHSKTILVGLPGHPAAAAIVFDLLVRDTLRERIGQSFTPYIEARIMRNVAAAPGRGTCMPVILHEKEDGLWAEPILGRSGNWSVLVKAEGYFMIHHNQEGVTRGDFVRVTLF